MKIKKLLQKEKALLCGLFLIALMIRLVIGLSMFSPPLGADPHTYETFALSILHGQNMCDSSVFMPLYPMFLAGIYFIGGHYHFLVVIVQTILSTLMCFIIYFLAKRLFNEKVAWLAGIFLCFNLAFIYAPRKILSETLYSFLLLVAMLFLIKFLQNYKIKDILFAALCLSLATLTRSLIFLFPFFICIYLIRILSRKLTFKLAFKTVSLFIVAFLLPIGIWTIRNFYVHHAFVPLTTHGAITLYASYTPDEGKIFGNLTYDEVFENARRITNEVEREKYYLDATLKYIRTNYDKIPKLLLLKIMYFFSLFDWEIIGYGIYNFSFAFILPFIFLGLFVSFRHNYDNNLWIIHLLLLYNLLVCLVFYGSPRFRMPIEPYLILFSASGIYYLWQRFKNKLIITLTTFAFFVVNLLAYLFSAQTKSSFKWIFEGLGLW